MSESSGCPESTEETVPRDSLTDWAGPVGCVVGIFEPKSYSWINLSQWAAQWWREERAESRLQALERWGWVARNSALDRLPGEVDTPAMDCLEAWEVTGEPVAVAAVLELIRHARSEADLERIGAGPLEDLLSHSGNRVAFAEMFLRVIDAVPGTQRVVAALWLGQDLPRSMVDRLIALGARDRRHPPAGQGL